MATRNCVFFSFWPSVLTVQGKLPRKALVYTVHKGAFLDFSTHFSQLKANSKAEHWFTVSHLHKWPLVGVDCFFSWPCCWSSEKRLICVYFETSGRGRTASALTCLLTAFIWHPHSPASAGYRILGFPPLLLIVLCGFALLEISFPSEFPWKISHFFFLPEEGLSSHLSKRAELRENLWMPLGVPLSWQGPFMAWKDGAESQL